MLVIVNILSDGWMLRATGSHITEEIAANIREGSGGSSGMRQFWDPDAVAGRESAGLGHGRIV